MKKHRHRRHKPRRNASGGSDTVALAPVAARPRLRPRIPRPTSSPPWQTMLAAIAGGGVSAAVGGLVVNQKILSPEAVGLGLMLGGGATAYYGAGHTRVVGTSMAAAGAGQFALAVMARKAGKPGHDPGSDGRPATPNAPHPAGGATAPPASLPPPRMSATGGVVVDLFRDAALDLDTIEDEWRYGVRDHRSDPRDAAEPYVIDLDEVA